MKRVVKVKLLQITEIYLIKIQERVKTEFENIYISEFY